MQTINIDFEVFKALTVRRDAESVTYNDVLRDLLGLGESLAAPVVLAASSANADKALGWTTKGVFFPIGTEFRARYDGVVHLGEVVVGGVKVGDKIASSPSRAARFVTHNSVNGWDFWECRLPGQSRWQSIKSLRPGQ